jgi:hypothetical protein
MQHPGKQNFKLQSVAHVIQMIGTSPHHSQRYARDHKVCPCNPLEDTRDSNGLEVDAMVAKAGEVRPLSQQSYGANER